MMDSFVIQRRSETTAAALPEGLHPLLRRIYAQRGIADSCQIDLSLTHLIPFDKLSGIQNAVSLLEEALLRQHRILIVGDFDADGATSTALAIRALRAMGARHVDYLVPNRFEYGYGLTPEIVTVGATKSPDLIITVDNGIASLDGVDLARSMGIRVLVTDHHLPGKDLPNANAIVNPNLVGDSFPSKHLAGVGVIFYVMAALRSRLRDSDWFVKYSIPEPNVAQYLDLVALGTVADVVPLDYNNRILVEQGLRRIRAGQSVPGIPSLLRLAGREPGKIVASDLAFAVGPRLNAAGRLQDMSLGIQCLLTRSKNEALAYAQELDELNRRRREIEGQMQEDALASLGKLISGLDRQDLPAGICLYQPDWHQGVIGILASRIKERFHRPVIAFADAGDGELKGSARSIPGVHMRDLLDTVATENPGLITRFGGHAMAAGLSLPTARLEQFSNAFSRTTLQVITPEHLNGHVQTDGELTRTELTLDAADALRHAGPWGQGFPEPVFDGEFEVLKCRVVGEKHLKMTVRPRDGAFSMDAIAFNYNPSTHLDHMQMVYRLESNEFRGVKRLQLVVTHLQAIT